MDYVKVFTSGDTATDRVLVWYNGDSYSRAGWGHENISYTCEILLRASTSDGQADNVKQRLMDIKNEVIHVLNSENHKLSGFTLHFARDYEMLSDPQYNSLNLAKGTFAIGRVRFYAYKPAEAIS